MPDEKIQTTAQAALIAELLGDVGKLTDLIKALDKSEIVTVAKRLEAAADKIEKSPLTMGGFDLMPPVQREQGISLVSSIFWFVLGLTVMYLILAR